MQRVELFLKDWWRDPQSAVGKYPVFVTDQGTVWALTIAVVDVAVVEQPHDNVRAWAVSAGTQRGDYNAVIGTNVVTEQTSRRDLATVNVFVSPGDGAIVVDVIDARAGVPLRVYVNDNTIHNHTIPD